MATIAKRIALCGVICCSLSDAEVDDTVAVCSTLEINVVEGSSFAFGTAS